MIQISEQSPLLDFYDIFRYTSFKYLYSFWYGKTSRDEIKLYFLKIIKNTLKNT